MSGDDDAWRDAARGLGLDPADPDVAEKLPGAKGTKKP